MRRDDAGGLKTSRARHKRCYESSSNPWMRYLPVARKENPRQMPGELREVYFDTTIPAGFQIPSPAGRTEGASLWAIRGASPNKSGRRALATNYFPVSCRVRSVGYRASATRRHFSSYRAAWASSVDSGRSGS